MGTILVFGIIPICFALACLAAIILNRKPLLRRAGLYALIAIGLFLVLGSYAILQVRSSTGALGFLFLPYYAMVPGGIAYALGTMHHSLLHNQKKDAPSQGIKVRIGVLIVLLLFPYTWMGYNLFDTLATNKARDNERERQKVAIMENTKHMEVILKKNPGREDAVLVNMANKTNDRTMLLPIAQSEFAPPELLDKLSRSTDFGVTVSAVSNPNALPESLERVYRTHKYPGYFFSSLAENKNTPTPILLELYGKRKQNSGIERGLARNPSVPAEILDILTRVSNQWLLYDLLKRPDLTCDHIDEISDTLASIPTKVPGYIQEEATNRCNDCSLSEGRGQ